MSESLAMFRAILFALLVSLPAVAEADGPADNLPTNVRRIPKLGIEVPAERRATLEAGLEKLAAALQHLRAASDARTQALLLNCCVLGARRRRDRRKQRHSRCHCPSPKNSLVHV